MKMLPEPGTVLGMFPSKLPPSEHEVFENGSEELTAILDGCQISFGDKAFHARRFRIRRCQKRPKC